MKLSETLKQLMFSLESGIMHSFHCKSLAVTATCFKRLPFVMTKEKLKLQCQLLRFKALKCKNLRLPHTYIFLESQMYLYPFVYFHFNATEYNKKMNTFVIK